MKTSHPLNVLARAALFTTCVHAVAFAGDASAAQGRPLDPERRPASDTVEEPPKPPPPEDPPLPPGEPPPPRTGFQLAFRTGVAIPAGNISVQQGMDEVFAAQIPFQLEIGAKVIPELFVGAYAGVGLGGVSSSFERDCNASRVDCSTRTTRIGVEAIVYFLPSGWVSPWLGYGFGYESSSQVGEASGRSLAQSVSGLEYARLMSGLDVRISRTVGVGPLVDVALGRYSSYERGASAASPAIDTDIEDTALHAWITLGARLVFFP